MKQLTIFSKKQLALTIPKHITVLGICITMVIMLRKMLKEHTITSKVKQY
jgi:hypothetical protein